MPKVSIIIPTYNGEKFIRETIDSALNQTFSDTEVIVINDGSTDSTASVLDSFGSRIKIVNKTNGGVASARNSGISEAKGEWIGLLDHDDLWYPTKLEKQLNFLNKNNYGMIYSKANQSQWSDGELFVRKVIGEPPVPRYGMYGSLFFSNFIPALTVLIKKDVINHIGLFDETVQPCDDWDMWLRISRSFSVGFHPEIVGIFRIHDKNFHARNISVMADAAYNTLKKNIAYAPVTLPINKVYVAHYCYLASQSAGIEDHRNAIKYLRQALVLRQPGRKLFSTFYYIACKIILNWYRKQGFSTHEIHF